MKQRFAKAPTKVTGATFQLKRTWATHTEHWYDQHFLVWSYDKVVGGEGGRRKVFAFATVSDRASVEAITD